jgi:sentrin-specific protease 1
VYINKLVNTHEAILQAKGQVQAPAQCAVSRAKILCLRPGEWLNDEVVNFFMGLLQARADAAAGPLRCHFFTSQWYAKLTEACTFQFARVKRWTKNVDIFALDLLFIPIHCNGNHWTLAVVNFCDKRFEYFDSIGHKDDHTGEYVRGGDGGRLTTLRRFVRDEHLDKKKASWNEAGWTDHVWLTGVETPMQTNGDDCAVLGVEYTTLCSRACGGLTQFLYDKTCRSYVCKKHRPCKCPPSEGTAVVERESTHAFTAASLAPVILEQACRQNEGIALP